ncbi:MAG: Rrf2 family transcriptional regulator [Pseudohongiellaceae bacterium]
MHITRYTDYSLRVLMYVALCDGRRANIQEIAEHYKISRNHLMKVVQSLNNQGYLETTRGKKGGIRLKLPAEEINLGELIRNTENDLVLVECLGQSNQCVIAPVCQLKNVFSQAMDSFFQVLHQYTLADLLPEPDRAGLQQILKI